MPDPGSLYGIPGGAPAGGFDVLGLNGSPNGQASPVFNTVPLAGQLQGAPMSGLLAGMMGLPTTSGVVPGAGNSAQPQGQGQAGGQMSPEQLQQLLQLLQASNQAGSTPQPGSALASSIGSGARSLFDGIMGAGR